MEDDKEVKEESRRKRDWCILEGKAMGSTKLYAHNGVYGVYYFRVPQKESLWVSIRSIVCLCATKVHHLLRVGGMFPSEQWMAACEVSFLPLSDPILDDSEDIQVPNLIPRHLN